MSLDRGLTNESYEEHSPHALFSCDCPPHAFKCPQAHNLRNRSLFHLHTHNILQGFAYTQTVIPYMGISRSIESFCFSRFLGSHPRLPFLLSTDSLHNPGWRGLHFGPGRWLRVARRFAWVWVDEDCAKEDSAADLTLDTSSVSVVWGYV